MMPHLSCFIIDDLPESIDTLSIYIERTPELVLMGTSTSAIPFLQILREGKIPDILFLDIEMPGIDGISLSKQLRNQCRIILVSGHTEMAIEAYDADCIDFLSKPVSFPRFYEAVNKVIRLIKPEQRINTSPSLLPVLTEPIPEYACLARPDEIGRKDIPEDIFAVPGAQQGSIELIKFQEILYLEIQDGEITIHSCNNQKHKDRRSLSSMEAILPDCFLQVERRYIVNLHYLSYATRTKIFIEGFQKGIPIGIRFQEKVKDYLKQLRRLEY